MAPVEWKVYRTVQEPVILEDIGSDVFFYNRTDGCYVIGRRSTLYVDENGVVINLDNPLPGLSVKDAQKLLMNLLAHPERRASIER